MRKRPTKNELKEAFVDNAPAEKIDANIIKEDLHKYVKLIKWPTDDTIINPSMATGSNLNKPITLAVKEFEWNTIDRHTKTIGVSKASWIKHAIFKLLQDEQLFCFKNKEKSNKT